MSDYIVQGENLTTLANKIREKTGEEAALEFPSEFVDAIDDMVVPSGNQDIDTVDEYNVEEKATARVSATERAKIISENIKKDVTILGVTGSYEGGGITGGYNVTFKVNNTNYAVVSVQAGESVTAPTIPHVTGYYFKGWSIGGGNVISFPYTPVADTTLYAIMETSAIVGFTGLSNETPGLTLTDDIANVAMWTTSVDSQYVNVSNPLDNYFPFSEIQEMTDSNGNVFVKFPKMWMKWILKEGTNIIDGVKFANYQVDNDYFVSDAYLNPADTSGSTFNDYFAIGKYEGSGSTSRVFSKSGQSCLVSITRADFRAGCRSYGTSGNFYNGYQCFDIQMYTIYNLLCSMYYRTPNFLQVYAGRTSRISQWSSASITGTCDGLSGMNGWNTNTDCIKMLGVENPYGNIWKWVDGIVPYYSSSNSKIYIRRLPQTYSDTTGGIEMGFAMPTNNGGEIRGFSKGTNEATRSAMFPSSVNILSPNYNKYVGSVYVFSSNTNTIATGSPYSGYTASGTGLWGTYNYQKSTDTLTTIGGRLAYRPTTN